MYAAGRTLSVAPRETEIHLNLSTNNFPEDLSAQQFRKCDLTFPISPGLQLSNTKWSVGLKALTIPSRIMNIDSSFKISILARTSVTEVSLSDACFLSLKSITDFLNREIGSKTSFGTNVQFGVSGKFATCLATSPAGMMPFIVAFSRNLCQLLGFDVGNPIVGTSTGTLSQAPRSYDPYAGFKLVEVKSSNADGFTTAQVPTENEEYPETSLGFLQVVSNFGIDYGGEKGLSDITPCTLHTVSIPMEDVVFYPLASQALHSLNFKLISLSSQLLKVDASVPVVLHVILRKSDHSFI